MQDEYENYEHEWNNWSMEGVNCHDGLLVPWIDRVHLSSGDRFGYGFLFLASLIYLFVCVSFISEAMMSRLRKMTSSWNKTVANFTSLSFVITAPQMYLMFFEIFCKSFNSGDMGPFTIIGSVAFRLFIIIDYFVCFYPLVAPNGRISNGFVFLASSFVSLISFIWLYLIVNVISKGEIEIFEAVLTMVPYPFVVLILFALDLIGRQGKKKVHNAAIAMQKGQPITDDVDGSKREGDDGANTSKGEYVGTANKEEQPMPSKTDINTNKTDRVWKVCHLILMPWLFIFDLLSKLPAVLDLVLSFIFAYLILMPIHIILIQDIAQHLGCLIHLKEREAGIFLLTLGFCIPSLISARKAVSNGETVDNIVSQMMGSNIMSVLLGIGFPWVILSSYHAGIGTDGGYQFPPGSFSFNVSHIFGSTVITTLVLLIGSLVPTRGQGKLQDDKIWRIIWGIIFALFWLLFLLLSFFEAYGTIDI